MKKLIIVTLLLLLSIPCYAQSTRIIYGKISDDGVRAVRMDKVFESLIMIDIDHHEIHEGDAYLFDSFADLGAGADRDHTMSTANSTKRTHLIYLVAAESEGTFTIFEDCTVLDDGTPITIFNHDRNSSNTSGNFLSQDSTIITEGPVLIQEKVGSGSKVGGASRGMNEIILKPNTKYTIRVSNDSIQTAWHDIELNWYEHSDRN